MKNVVFWDVVLCSSGVNRRFGGTYRLHLQGRKSESEEEDDILHSHRCESLKSYTVQIMFEKIKCVVFYSYRPTQCTCTLAGLITLVYFS
jgi:hypothetical protein